MCTSGFVDDIMFPYNGGNRPEPKTTRFVQFTRWRNQSDVRQRCLVQIARWRHRRQSLLPLTAYIFPAFQLGVGVRIDHDDRILSDRSFSTTWELYVAYRTAAIPTTLSDLQHRSPIARLQMGLFVPLRSGVTGFQLT